MQIDRRITNGLAWAGAALVIGIPTLDFVMRQFSPENPRAAVVSPASPQVNTPVAEAANGSVPVTSTPAPQTPAPQQTANASGDAVDQFVQSGRPLPSYISNGGTTPAPVTPPAASPKPTATTPVAPAATQPAATQTAARPPIASNPPAATTPRTVIVTLPTPVSQRPPSRPSIGPTTLPVVQPGQTIQPIQPPPAPVAQPPLVINDGGAMVTAQDLDDWESGPLSDFLARRARERNQQYPAGQYSPDGFYLDEYYSDFGQ